jgi:hypothetical protein
METKFKIGDRKWLCDEDGREPAASGPKTCYYYEEVTRNGRQWFRMTPKGDWMPKRETVEQKYDRAGMATAAMKEIMSWDGMTDSVVVAKQAVRFTDALIAELQRTEK